MAKRLPAYRQWWLCPWIIFLKKPLAFCVSMFKSFNKSSKRLNLRRWVLGMPRPFDTAFRALGCGGAHHHQSKTSGWCLQSGLRKRFQHHYTYLGNILDAMAILHVDATNVNPDRLLCKFSWLFTENRDVEI